MKAAKKLKLDKKNKEILRLTHQPSDKSALYFGSIRQYVLDEQERRKQEYKWRVVISPSAKLSLNLCVEAFFKRADKFLEFAPKTLCSSIEFGKIMHAGLFELASKVPHLLYPAPHFDDPAMRNWHNQVEPETPLAMPDLHFRGICDQILAVLRDGKEHLDVPLTLENVVGIYRPVPADFKTIRKSKKEWEKFKQKGRPLMHHKGQVCAYAYAFNRMKCLPEPVEECAILYYNTAMPFLDPDAHAEFYFDYTPKLDKITGDMLQGLADGCKAYIAGKRIFCQREFCATHGAD